MFDLFKKLLWQHFRIPPTGPLQGKKKQKFLSYRHHSMKSISCCSRRFMMKRLLERFSVLINTDLSIGLIRSKNFRNIYKNYLGNRGDQESADTSFDELSRRNFAPGPVKHVYVEEKKIRHHHPHHKRHHHYRHKHSKNYI